MESTQKGTKWDIELLMEKRIRKQVQYLVDNTDLTEDEIIDDISTNFDIHPKKVVAVIETMDL